jgi:hypothetical protein
VSVGNEETGNGIGGGEWTHSVGSAVDEEMVSGGIFAMGFTNKVYLWDSLNTAVQQSHGTALIRIFPITDYNDSLHEASIRKVILTHFRMQNFHQMFQSFKDSWTGTIEEIAINLKQLAVLYRCQGRPPFPRILFHLGNPFLSAYREQQDVRILS